MTESLEAILPATPVSVSRLHPEPKHIFRLWQIFVEKVNPITKIIHVPTMQQRITEASWNLEGATKPTVAIMFAVYTLAVTSISAIECEELFREDKATLVSRYRAATIQALLAAGLLTTRDLEVLQAFLLLLLTDPYSDLTSTLTGLAIRIAEKMGLPECGPVLPGQKGKTFAQHGRGGRVEKTFGSEFGPPFRCRAQDKRIHLERRRGLLEGREHLRKGRRLVGEDPLIGDIRE